MPETTAELYDRESPSWRRAGPVLLSDFTARPFLLEWCKPVAGADVLDLGCGEGYFARALRQRGARSVVGLDVSAEMIAAAREAEDVSDARAPIEYHVGDALDLGHLVDGSFDLVVAVFLFNYVSSDVMARILAEVRGKLRPEGKLVFAVPHPSLPFLRSAREPFYFDPAGAGYFAGRDTCFEGRIWRLDGKSVPVRCVHKTFADYFRALRSAGFAACPEVEELHVTAEHLALEPEFFASLVDQPLHVALRVAR